MPNLLQIPTIKFLFLWELAVFVFGLPVSLYDQKRKQIIVFNLKALLIEWTA